MQVTHSNMTFTTYSDRYDPIILKERILDKIHYKGLDLKDLRVNWTQIFKNPTKDLIQMTCRHTHPDNCDLYITFLRDSPIGINPMSVSQKIFPHSNSLCL